MCNGGCCPPKPGYLQAVRSLCDQYGVLLCFDEIITGYRVGLGGAQAQVGVTPDLATFGKALTAGVPLAAVTGRKDILGLLRTNRVIGAGTFNSFPVAMAAALTSIRMLEQDDGAYYAKVDRAQPILMDGLQSIAKKYGHPILVQGPRGLFYFDFIDRQVAWSPRDLAMADRPKALRLRNLLIEEGVLIGRGNRWFVSGLLTDQDIDFVLGATDRAFARL